MSLIGVTKNIVVVGNGSVGKTSLLLAFTQGTFPEIHVATVYDTEEITMTIDGNEHYIKLHDTAGQEDYERLRRFSYHLADAFVLCYDITDRVSFDNIELKWIDELRGDNEDIPVILVATKEDKRNRHCVPRKEGEDLCGRIRADAFFECSAKTGKNVEEIFIEAARAAIRGSRKVPENSSWLCCCCRWFSK
ncbi:ras-like GTP-binding protein RhoL [Lutzomyia longipalpis]|uniref:ras-like GTP-binding protein RhoL n=1 Tax=Lutzomyia longipalpis TaxID=7200 RepID=UPI002483830D|nr:ras-like GTP-binding protein RhoL [Lutzomyia longipalpis]